MAEKRPLEEDVLQGGEDGEQDIGPPRPPDDGEDGDEEGGEMVGPLPPKQKKRKVSRATANAG